MTMIRGLDRLNISFGQADGWWGRPWVDFLLRLDFRLDVSGIVGGDFSFSPVLPDDGLSKVSGTFSMKIDGLCTLVLPW